MLQTSPRAHVDIPSTGAHSEPSRTNAESPTYATHDALAQSAARSRMRDEKPRAATERMGGGRTQAATRPQA